LASERDAYLASDFYSSFVRASRHHFKGLLYRVSQALCCPLDFISHHYYWSGGQPCGVEELK